MNTDLHTHFMQHALALASRGTGHVHPNPMVGCVIVHEGAIIGEGWHQKAGTAHAEVHALNAASDRARGATLYVTLEPCNHHGRTPPCCEAIITAGISTVIIATRDPNPSAQGGLERLQAAGIEVQVGVCEADARFINRFFFNALARKRPWIIAKFAASLDGRTATRNGDSQWISNTESRLAGHQLRQAVDAIVIGRITAETDNPSLTVRHPDIESPAHPVRIVLDSQARLNPDRTRLLQGELPGLTLWCSSMPLNESQQAILQPGRVEHLQVPDATDDGQLDLDALMPLLHARQIHSLLVEGGAMLHGSFLDAGLIDEVHAFIAPLLIGGTEARPSIGGIGSGRLSEALRLDTRQVEALGNDLHVQALHTSPLTLEHL